jgi:hypothetical protein
VVSSVVAVVFSAPVVSSAVVVAFAGSVVSSVVLPGASVSVVVVVFVPGVVVFTDGVVAFVGGVVTLIGVAEAFAAVDPGRGAGVAVPAEREGVPVEGVDPVRTVWSTAGRSGSVKFAETSSKSFGPVSFAVSSAATAAVWLTAVRNASIRAASRLARAT